MRSTLIKQSFSSTDAAGKLHLIAVSPFVRLRSRMLELIRLSIAVLHERVAEIEHSSRIDGSTSVASRKSQGKPEQEYGTSTQLTAEQHSSTQHFHTLSLSTLRSPTTRRRLVVPELLPSNSTLASDVVDRLLQTSLAAISTTDQSLD